MIVNFLARLVIYHSDRAGALRDYLRYATGHHAMMEVFFEEAGA